MSNQDLSDLVKKMDLDDLPKDEKLNSLQDDDLSIGTLVDTPLPTVRRSNRINHGKKDNRDENDSDLSQDENSVMGGLSFVTSRPDEDELFSMKGVPKEIKDTNFELNFEKDLEMEGQGEDILSVGSEGEGDDDVKRYSLFMLPGGGD